MILAILIAPCVVMASDPDNGTSALVDQMGRNSQARYDRMADNASREAAQNAATSAQQATADAINRKTVINTFYNVPYQTTPAATK